ncbi:MAG: phosphatidylserine/phosphatidylglycerophosphate/cardiolipin synthase family protein [Proteobacteria bacterium]|nr:MAG: phosphatidylserine/phosphatidylglycerophosphate/cardiolipin synthase family protein [Pseudomonadota bacterium]
MGAAAKLLLPLRFFARCAFIFLTNLLFFTEKPTVDYSRPKPKRNCSFRRMVAAFFALFLPFFAQAAERAGLLFTPQESMRARYDVIRRAQKEILLSTFSVVPDDAGMALLEELAKKARAGVPTRLLIDGVSHQRDRGKMHDVLLYLQDSGVEIREFVSQTTSAKLQRAAGLSGFAAEKLHAKVTIGDEIAVSGGRNLNNQGLRGPAPGAQDVDAIFTGEAVSSAKSHLRELWDSPETQGVKFRQDQISLERGRDIVKRAYGWMENAGIVDPDRASDPIKLTKPVKRVHFLHDSAAHVKGPSPTAMGLQSLFAGAKEEVLVSNHTLNLTQGFWKAFGQARKNGAQVNLLTNAEDRYPGGAKEGRWASYVKSYRRLAGEGINLREHRDRASLHAKVAVIDGERAVISSFNLEPASEYLNKETAVVIEDRKLAQDLKSYVGRHYGTARQVVENGKLIAEAPAKFKVDCGTAFHYLQLLRGFR